MFLFPMVGHSSRFFNCGYKIPKYQLPLHERTVFSYVLSSFENYFDNDLFLFVVRPDFNSQFFIETELKKLKIRNYKIVVLSHDTEGQAQTCYEGILHAGCSFEEELYVFNIDTFRPDFIKAPWANDCDGYLEVFIGEGENWSFVEPSSNGKVKKTTEKERISDFCSDGLYFFNNVSFFNSAYLDSFNSNNRSKGEYYVAPLYNYLIKHGLDIRYHLIQKDEVIFCGTPSEYLNLGGLAP